MDFEYFTAGWIHQKTLLEKHKDSVDVKVLKGLSEFLKNPVIELDSKKDDNSKIVLGELKGKKQNSYSCSPSCSDIEKRKKLNLIKISSFEGRSHIQSLLRCENGKAVTIRYYDKNRIQSWLNANRLQLPLRSFNSNPVGNITEKTGIVNTAIFKKDGNSYIV